MGPRGCAVGGAGVGILRGPRIAGRAGPRILRCPTNLWPGLVGRGIGVNFVVVAHSYSETPTYSGPKRQWGLFVPIPYRGLVGEGFFPVRA